MKNNQNPDPITLARREYHRQWRKNNPDKVAAAMQRFWEKKLKQMEAAKEEGKNE